MAFSASCITLIPDGRDIWGKTNVQFATFVPTASDYTTGGYLITPAMFAMRKLTYVWLVAQYTTTGPASPTTAYWPLWNTVAPGLQFFSPTGSGGALTFTGTPAVLTGTNAAPTISITGGVGGTVAIGIGSDANAAALSKTTATTRTGITGVQAPALTMDSYTPAGAIGGSVTIATLTELSASADLSAFTFILQAFGND